LAIAIGTRPGVLGLRDDVQELRPGLRRGQAQLVEHVRAVPDHRGLHRDRHGVLLAVELAGLERRLGDALGLGAQLTQVGDLAGVDVGLELAAAPRVEDVRAVGGPEGHLQLGLVLVVGVRLRVDLDVRVVGEKRSIASSTPTASARYQMLTVLLVDVSPPASSVLVAVLSPPGLQAVIKTPAATTEANAMDLRIAAP
jgi:hypothetical protein